MTQLSSRTRHLGTNKGTIRQKYLNVEFLSYKWNPRWNVSIHKYGILILNRGQKGQTWTRPVGQPLYGWQVPFERQPSAHISSPSPQGPGIEERHVPAHAPFEHLFTKNKYYESFSWTTRGSTDFSEVRNWYVRTELWGRAWEWNLEEGV